MKDRHKAVPAVYAVFVKDDKVLLQERCNTGFMDGLFGLPSGHVEKDEDIIEALIRETREEIGIVIDPQHTKHIHTNYYPAKYRDDENDYINLFFMIKEWDGKPKNLEPKKCSKLDWFPLDALPENNIGYVMDAMLLGLQGVSFSETSE